MQQPGNEFAAVYDYSHSLLQGRFVPSRFTTEKGDFQVERAEFDLAIQTSLTNDSLADRLSQLTENTVMQS